jgi:tRNA1Val (adenine37-N6)-methyltransferase
MKIGTDGVLLGAWCPVDNHPKNILDIGAGTGIIALMLAQRSNAEQIDGIEIEDNAYEECVDNFENSPWSDRLYCFHAGLEELMDDPEDEYDIIVSNPPFYKDKNDSDDSLRALARSEKSLPFELLIEAADLLLSEIGIFATIIPRKEEDNFISICKLFELFPFKILRVKGTVNSEEKRSLIAFNRIETKPEITTISIEISRHLYTDEYKKIVRDFYLKME